MATMAEQSYAVLPGRRNEHDFLLYPDPHQPCYASPSMDIDLHYNPDAYGFQRHAPESFAHPTTGLEAGSMYADMSHYVFSGTASPGVCQEDRARLRAPSSNLSSNTSAPSASSSTVGSPNSHPDRLTFIPDVHQTDMGVNPGIVTQPDYFPGNEYSFSAPPMEDFNMAFESKHNFVGESELFSPDQSGSAASRPPQTFFFVQRIGLPIAPLDLTWRFPLCLLHHLSTPGKSFVSILTPISQIPR